MEADAKCISKCIPPGDLWAALIYLYAQEAGVSVDPTTLEAGAKCISKCIPPGDRIPVLISLLAKFNGASADPTTLLAGAKCISRCIPPGDQLPVLVSLVASSAHDPWTPPAWWLPLPTVSPGQELAAGLFLVSNTDDNFVALTVSGNYQVDWGDGTVSTVTAGVAAQHQYNYSTLSSPLDPFGNKMAVVKITPQSGAHLTSVNFTTRHSTLTQSGALDVPWLNISVGGASIATLKVGGGSTVNLGSLQLFTLVDHALTSLANFFQNCYALASVPLFNTASVTNMSGMFNACYALQSVPLFNTASVTDMSSMFQNCYALQSVPLFNTASVTNMSNMFVACYALQSVPLFNTASVTNMSQMFAVCYALQSVPLFNTASVTNMDYMFLNCYALASVLMAPIKVSISFAKCSLSASDLNAIFGNLATVSGKTITITGNYGAATCDTTIATGKGWTVTN
jgi:surface protein